MLFRLKINIANIFKYFIHNSFSVWKPSTGAHWWHQMVKINLLATAEWCWVRNILLVEITIVSVSCLCIARMSVFVFVATHSIFQPKQHVQGPAKNVCWRERESLIWIDWPNQVCSTQFIRVNTISQHRQCQKASVRASRWAWSMYLGLTHTHTHTWACANVCLSTCFTLHWSLTLKTMLLVVLKCQC